jgi:hypothetical protein
MADNIFTTQWNALKNFSHFYDPSGSKSRAPIAGGVLRASGNDSPTLLSMSNTRGGISTIFIRECYILWFDKFLKDVKAEPEGKFALSSSPGCGKSMADNFIFKMAASDPLLSHKPILYQFGKTFYHFNLDSVFLIDRMTAQNIALLKETFYVLDGHSVDPLHSECLTLFISSPLSDTFKKWHYHTQISPRYLPV